MWNPERCRLWVTVMKHLIAAFTIVAALTASGCQSGPSSKYPAAQQVVSDIAASHSDIVRLSLHGKLDGGEAVCIASTAPEKVGKPSDKEDVDAMDSGVPVEMPEGQNFDYTAPIKDRNGVPFAAVGVTVSGKTTEEMKARAESIAAEVQREVNNSPNPLW